MRRWWLSPRAVGTVLAGVVLLWQGPSFVRVLRPPSTIRVDFFQDWASARNLLDDRPIYADVAEMVERHQGWRVRGDLPPWYWRVNAHPPPAVLPVVALAWLDYPDACLVWNLLSLTALVASLALIARQLHIGMSTWAILPVLAFLVVCPPLRQHVFQGQSSLVLLLLLTITWVAARQARPWAAGLALGAATAIKLFPGLLFIYFVWRRQWTVVAAGLAALSAITALTVTVVGLQTYYTYAVEVLPSVGQFRSHWVNASLVGVWFKLFDPSPSGGSIVPLWQSPTLARVGMVVSLAAIAAGVAWVARRASMRGEGDLAFGVTVIGMLLASPLTWDHYFVLLLLPLVIMWVRLPPSGAVRWLWFALVGMLLVPPGWVWTVLIPGGWPQGIVTPVQTLTALSFQCYALLGLFVLAMVAETWAASEVLGESSGTSRSRNR